MVQIAPADVAGTLPQYELTFVDPGSPELARLPGRWQAIALSTSPESRLQAALDLWNQDFLDFVPRFAAALRAHFIDVRACLVRSGPILVYVARNGDGDLVSWAGHDPRSFREPPVLWEIVPKPLQTFLREVHAGFMSGMGAGYGPAGPGDIGTLADLSDFPEGIPGWEHAEIPTTRLLQVATDGGHLLYCLSPDLPPGQVALVYEGNIDPPADFATELDDLMMSRLDLDE